MAFMTRVPRVEIEGTVPPPRTPDKRLHSPIIGPTLCYPLDDAQVKKEFF